jgi:hypothetical protein
MLMTPVEEAIALLCGRIALLQFPLYGALLRWSRWHKSSMGLAVAASLHLAAVTVSFAGAIPKFSWQFARRPECRQQGSGHSAGRPPHVAIDLDQRDQRRAVAALEAHIGSIAAGFSMSIFTNAGSSLAKLAAFSPVNLRSIQAFSSLASSRASDGGTLGLCRAHARRITGTPPSRAIDGLVSRHSGNRVQLSTLPLSGESSGRARVAARIERIQLRLDQGEKGDTT